MFRVAAIWNLLVGLTGIFLYSFCLDLIAGHRLDTITDLTLIFYRFFMIAVIIFGIGYYLVSVNLEKNDGIVWMGACAKTIIFGFVLIDFLTGDATLFFLMIASTDLIFAVFFFLYLLSKKNYRF